MLTQSNTNISMCVGSISLHEPLIKCEMCDQFCVLTRSSYPCKFLIHFINPWTCVTGCKISAILGDYSHFDGCEMSDEI